MLNLNSIYKKNKKFEFYLISLSISKSFSSMSEICDFSINSFINSLFSLSVNFFSLSIFVFYRVLAVLFFSFSIAVVVQPIYIKIQTDHVVTNTLWKRHFTTSLGHLSSYIDITSYLCQGVRNVKLHDKDVEVVYRLD